MSEHREYPKYDIAHYKALVTRSEDKLRQAIQRLLDATHDEAAKAVKAVEEAESEVAEHKALLEYKLIEFEKKPKQESSSDAIKHEASSSLKETPLYAIGSPDYVKRTNGTESIAVVKNYDANSKLYDLELDGIDPNQINRSLAKNMRNISLVEYEAIQREAEELRNLDDVERRKAELEYRARSRATMDAQRRIARAKARSEGLVTLTGGRRNTKNIEDAIKEKQSIIRKKQNVTPKNGICAIKIYYIFCKFMLLI